MAKVQGKKTVASARRATAKVAAKAKTTTRTVKKRVASKPAAPAKRSAKPARPAARPVKALKRVKTAKPAPKSAKPAKALKAVKPLKAAKALKVVKPLKAAKPLKVVKPLKAAKPLKVVKPLNPAKAVVVPLPKKLAATPSKAPVAPPVRPAGAAAPAAEAKRTRTRRPRPRVHSNGAPVAAWLPPGAVKPRPSSFIPAPARAEAPSLIAAPPASSDRLIRPEDVTEFVTRMVPVRVDIEAGGGRTFISVNPEEVFVKPGEGIEWDFRYIGGADVTVDEVTVEFERPSPFATVTFRSRKPGPARPHRQLSGPVQKNAVGKRLRYTIRAMSPFKTELATIKPHVNVV